MMMMMMEGWKEDNNEFVWNVYDDQREKKNKEQE